MTWVQCWHCWNFSFSVSFLSDQSKMLSDRQHWFLSTQWRIFKGFWHFRKNNWCLQFYWKSQAKLCVRCCYMYTVFRVRQASVRQSLALFLFATEKKTHFWTPVNSERFGVRNILMNLRIVFKYWSIAVSWNWKRNYMYVFIFCYRSGY